MSRSASGSDLSYPDWNAIVHEEDGERGGILLLLVGAGFPVEAQHEIGRNGDAEGVGAAHHAHFRSLDHLHPGLVGAVERFAVGGYGYVAVAEAYLVGFLGISHAHAGFAEGHIFFTRGVNDAGIYYYSEQEVEEHSGYHDQQALPGRFAAEFPFLRRLLHLLGVHRLVDHAGDLAIASERKPADAIFGVSPEGTFFLFVRLLFADCFGFSLGVGLFFGLGFLQFAGFAEESEIFPRFPFENLGPGIEENIEFLNFHPENAGEKEMSEFVDDNKDSKSENQLCGLYSKCFQNRVSVF